MIVIINKSKPNLVYAPKTMPTIEALLKMELIGETDKKNYVMELVDETYSDDFFTFTIDASELPDQEYKYTIKTLDNEFLASGLMRVGKIISDKTNKNIEIDLL